MVLLSTLALSVVFCGAYLWVARRLQILDQPNERSSHARPTPHGGGLPMLVAMGLGLAIAAVAWEEQYLLLMALAYGLSAVGVLDDLRGLSVRLRFALYLLCCVLAVIIVQAPLADPVLASLVGAAISAVALLWMLNLYNFMDTPPPSALPPAPALRCWPGGRARHHSTCSSACYWRPRRQASCSGTGRRPGCLWVMLAVSPRAFCWVRWPCLAMPRVTCLWPAG